jgi:fucose 4-O-acetylase-like acetyltransferase
MTTSMISHSSRIPSIDIARAVAILLVIYAHGLQAFFVDRPDGGFSEGAFAQWRMIYSFHMPLFFVISGMASAGLAQKSWRAVLKNALNLLLLAYMTHVAGFIIAALAGQIDTPALMIKRLVLPLLIGKDFSIVVTWFLVALAVVQIFAYGVIKYAGSPRYLFLLLALCLYISAPLTGNIFQIKALAPGLIFFLFGYVLASNRPKTLRRFLPALPFLICATYFLSSVNDSCLLDWALTCSKVNGRFADFLRGHFGVLMIVGYYGFFPLFIAAALAGSLSILMLGALLERSILARPLSLIGQRTLELVIVNGFLVVFLQPRFNTPQGIDNYFIYTGFAFATIIANIVIMLLSLPLTDRLKQIANSGADRIISTSSLIGSRIAQLRLGR